MTFFLDPRVWVVMAFSFFLGGAIGGATGYWRGDVAGANAERTAWQKKEIDRQIAEAAAVGRRVKENEAKQAANDANNLKDGLAHEAALKTVVDERDALRAAVKRSRGLRIPASVCDRPADSAKTTADGGLVDAAAGTVALPEQVASDLLDLAAEADAVVEQARAMQKRLLEDAAEGGAQGGGK